MTPRKREQLDWVSLLESILADTPSLPEAACIGRHDLFDEGQGESKDEARHRQAVAEKLCAGCPEAWRCPERTDQPTAMTEAQAS
ncbi:hypothetical protein [Rhodococcus opacus]|uniref:4Fe-4S Wbl-type domain-containing protein n=1 Tax=Rhodococcus opacus (strain B4) TaxID=632772 RepID=C1B984_RHOOB|nr:hypothetical protein [Rhodococcus opacus]BAH52237.1 hypothetical protein ROP_39900 [Rhodococcus opacus B4]